MSRYPRPTMLAILGSVFLLAACATPEARLRTGLVNAGLPIGLSDCMARDMTPRLSIKQLLRLRDLSNVGARDPMRTSIDRYLHQVRALGDTEILTITGRAATRCTLGL